MERPRIVNLSLWWSVSLRTDSPPVIILSGKQVLLRWFDAIQEDEHLAVTDTGYINDQLAYQWIQKFHKWTAPRTKGGWRLLFCDRFGSHMTMQFLKFCEQVNILPFFLPAHTSHILQPLDVGVYKQYHAKAVEEATVTGCQNFYKGRIPTCNCIKSSNDIPTFYDYTRLENLAPTGSLVV